MSCDAAALALSLHLAQADAAMNAAPRLIPISTAAAPMNPLAREPLFSDIVKRAASLEKQVGSWRAAPPSAAPASFADQAAQLSALDMQGHVELAKRGTDGDLKCILKGISQDLPKKVAALQTALTADDRKLAVSDLYYLLRDNVEVITTPPKQTSTDKVG